MLPWKSRQSTADVALPDTRTVSGQCDRQLGGLPYGGCFTRVDKFHQTLVKPLIGEICTSRAASLTCYPVRPARASLLRQSALQGCHRLTTSVEWTGISSKVQFWSLGKLILRIDRSNHILRLNASFMHLSHTRMGLSRFPLAFRPSWREVAIKLGLHFFSPAATW